MTLFSSSFTIRRISTEMSPTTAVLMPSGSIPSQRSSSAFTRSATPTRLAPVRFSMLRVTDGSWSTRERLVWSSNPKTTSATSRTNTGSPSRTLITKSSISDGCRTSAGRRTRYSSPPTAISPPGTFLFSRATATTTSERLSSKNARRFGSTCTWTSRSRPPITFARLTPGIVSRSSLISSATSVRRWLPTGPDSVITMIGTWEKSMSWTRGSSASGGRSDFARSTFSRTLASAVSRSVSGLNSTAMLEKPSLVVELISLIPETAWISVSMGRVTSVSMSVGLTPG